MPILTDPKDNIGIDGVSPQVDNDDIIAVSLYGDSGETSVSVDEDGALWVRIDSVFGAMLKELRKITFQLALITDVYLESSDVE